MSATSQWISDIFESRDPDKVSNANTSNEGIVFNRISKVLLARRIVFRAFIEESRVLNDGALHEQIKLDWLLLQILPLVHVEDKDPFTALIHSCLIGATDGHLDSLNFGLAPTSVLGSAFNPTVDKFFHVLDEAQVAGKQYMGAFADADGEVPRSVLSPIVRHLTTLDDPLVRVIVSGTGFSLEQFKNVLGSGVSKGEDPWDLEHTTGDFTDQNLQLAYISRYLPPSFLLSSSGEILKTRMYEWLRGRYRFTARFLEELLSGHWETYRPASPHKLLNAYVYTLAYFTPLDGDKTLMKSEPDVEPIGVQGFYWEKIERSPQKLDLFNQLAHLIFTYITRGPYPMGYYELKPLVEYGLARFIKRDTITVEEPLAIVSIVLYFKFKRFTLDEDTYARLQDDKGRAFKELVLLKITKPLWNGQTLRSIF
ncbi:hypothetical protein M408DRAFT_20008 [Serendipita vermifera MAFF 305830]|uniref:Uncharacterized protein n=1 Tax=Serendipita vermifera MAFF 305830 TaxID=933852 RepID=A0A0C3BKS2_SERVB|nr:hypothetical protein M408DRAFT_20008 [Serendipita vermifera MAFF 305830]